jgi:hypothetical protein
MRRFFYILIILPVLTWECEPKQNNDGNITKFQIFESYNQIHILKNGRHFTSYLYDSILLKPILYPVYSPSGIRVQRQYPLLIVDGESHDHPHHAGLSFTYGTKGEVNGNNFWAGQQGSTKIRHSRVTQMKTEPDFAILGIQAEWIGQEGELVLEENRTMVFSGDEVKSIIDFTFELKAINKEVVFNDTKEGMFAIRVADWLSEENGNGIYLNSNGDTTESNVWGKPAKWVRLDGRNEGKKIGVVVMNHPSSVNFPTYWHARAYGLFSANSLGKAVFEKGRGIKDTVPLNFTIPAGNTALFRFRMIIYEGEMVPDQIEALFEEYENN